MLNTYKISYKWTYIERDFLDLTKVKGMYIKKRYRDLLLQDV